MDIIAALERLEDEYHQVQEQLSDPEVIADSARLRELSVRHSELEPAVEKLVEFRGHLRDRDEGEALLAEAEDEQMREFLQGERDEAQARLDEMHNEVLALLVPPDRMRDRNAIVEIRAGTGGDEAALFAGDLFDMYSAFVGTQGWEVEVMSVNGGEMGGYKEVIFGVKGGGAYGTLKHESGVHRVQRVPVTESSGRIHTSAATVAVLPEAEEIDVRLNPEDLEFETFRAGGPGGQHMQKNETAVRITHKPTGVVAASKDERSQRRNREKALRVLRARIYEQMQQEQQSKVAAERKAQVKSGDRSEKVRTYNFPQDRVTDHRVGLTLHNLPAILTGGILPLIEALQEHERQEKLEELLAS
jgi:peptide chain release factor 1